MKICVYAICKNEEKFVDRWVKSMSEADEIVVLDTGSTDNTVDKLKSYGVKVYEEKIEPWRFDVARNLSLDKVSKDVDICVCTDLDEVFEKGWRANLEKIWDDKTNRVRYNYNWSFDEYGNPATNFYIEKIHSRDGYKWVHPVHEVLKYTKSDAENFKTSDEITLNHYPDSNKSRGQYLNLLELSVKEDENDDRNMHYLGREYMYYGKWNECIDTLIKHLNLKSATWKDERCASMRFIARAYTNLKRYDEARMWLHKAIEEAPYLREPYVELAFLEYQFDNYNEVYNLLHMALKIKERGKSYINEHFCFDSTIYDLLSIACLNLNKLDESLENVNIALSLNPNDERIQNNKNIILDMKKNDI